MLSGSEKDLVIITTNNPKMLKKMDKKLHYKLDKRIKFVGTVYDQELLMKIRENSYGSDFKCKLIVTSNIETDKEKIRLNYNALSSSFDQGYNSYVRMCFGSHFNMNRIVIMVNRSS